MRAAVSRHRLLENVGCSSHKAASFALPVMLLLLLLLLLLLRDLA